MFFLVLKDHLECYIPLKKRAADVCVCVCVCQMDMGVHHMPGVCAPSVRSDKLHAGMAT